MKLLIRKAMAAVLTRKTRRAAFGRTPRKSHLAASLAASIVLHALVLTLDFGDSGMFGSDLSGAVGNERRANVPELQAILREPIKSSLVKEKIPPPRAEKLSGASVRIQPRKLIAKKPETLAADPLVETASTMSSIKETKTLPVPTTETQTRIAVAESPEQSPIPVTDKEVAVLATDQESSWSMSVAKTARQQGEEVTIKEDELERIRAAEMLERTKAEQAENQRREEFAAIARATELALERRRIEEERNAAEQAAQTRVKEEALAQARLEEERRKAEQAAAVKAREEAAARKIAAEALARTEKLSAAPDRAVETKEFPNDGGARNLPDRAGKAEGMAAQQSAKGSNLAGRALEQARSSLVVSPMSQPAPADRQRRGSILGRDPKDIQLAFYGEGWRQKVERIGSMNYPKLSRNRHYDPLLVTVSINSDGSLAAVRIVKSSGQKDLDDAVRRIVEMSAPFAAFPPDLKRSYDVVDITRSWSFVEERPRIYDQ